MSETNKNKIKNPNKHLGNNPSGKKFRFNILWVYGIVFVILMGMQLFFSGNASVGTDWKTVRQTMLQKGDVEKVVLERSKLVVEIYIKRDSLTKDTYVKYGGVGGFSGLSATGPQFHFQIGSIDTFEKQFYEAQEGLPFEEVPLKYELRKSIFYELLSWLPLIAIIALWIYMFKRMSAGPGKGAGGGGIFSVGKSRAQIFDKDTMVRVTFKDVAGLEGAKTEVGEIVEFLKQPKKYTDLGGKIPRGALLVGPPGTGKTLLAKAVAGEANVPFFSISGSDFVEMFVGVGASRVRDLFKQAKEKSPCIIFIDEIDAIGRARGKNPNFGSNDERENTLNQLLTEMDGFTPNNGVIILAATNRADILDRALLRAGRFDRQISVDLPDLNERKDIFKVHLRPLKLQNGLDVEFLSKQTPGFSGADIANVCNEAALIAARKNKIQVEKQDFLDAIDRIIGGLEKKNKIISVNEKKTIAYHEAGHATVSWKLEHASPLIKVTIIPRGMALGAAWYLPDERQITTYAQMFDEMCSILGGRASEELTFGTVSTGALNDLERVTKMAYAMVAYYGMDDQIGNLSFYDSTGSSEYSFHRPYSEKTAEAIDKQVTALIEKAYETAKTILTENSEGLAKLAQKLLDTEVIFTEDVEAIFGKRPWTKAEMYTKQSSEQNSELVPPTEETEHTVSNYSK